MAIIVLAVLLILVSVFAIIISIKLMLFKRATYQVAERLDFIMTSDTNIEIDSETAERSLNILVRSLNKNLNELKKLKNSYRKKDIEQRETITNISHDLRTPLTVITSYINLIERSNRNLDDKTLANLEIIKSKAAYMNVLVSELFNYTMIESECVPLELTDICLNDVLEKGLTEFYNAIIQHGISPQISICEQPVMRKLNSTAIDRVINNILSNVVKYSSGDLSVNLSESGSITFVNTAQNIDTIAVGKLFDRFFTVENARLSTGLGLSIAKILTEQMKGEISATMIGDQLHICLKF